MRRYRASQLWLSAKPKPPTRCCVAGACGLEAPGYQWLSAFAALEDGEGQYKKPATTESKLRRKEASDSPAEPTVRGPGLRSPLLPRP